MPFSVLMSLYSKERPEFLKESLDSIFSQTITPDEVVMVEDGPLTTELYGILDEYSAKYPVLKRVPLPVNGGLGKALNEGLRHCAHELVARMDTDDIACPDRFELQLEVFERYPQADVVSAWIDEFEETPDNIVSTRRLPEYPYEIYKYAKKRCPVNHPVVMFRRSAVLFAGGYRHFPLFEDYFLWVRLLMNGSKFYNVQKSLLRFRTTRDMFRRRGGLKHALTEIRFQNFIRRIGFISWGQMLFNIPIRFITRIIPNNFRTFVYKKFLRG